MKYLWVGFLALLLGCQNSSGTDPNPTSPGRPDSVATAAAPDGPARPPGGAGPVAKEKVEVLAGPEALLESVPQELRPGGADDKIRIAKANAWLKERYGGKPVACRVKLNGIVLGEVVEAEYVDRTRLVCDSPNGPQPTVWGRLPVACAVTDDAPTHPHGVTLTALAEPSVARLKQSDGKVVEVSGTVAAVALSLDAAPATLTLSLADPVVGGVASNPTVALTDREFDRIMARTKTPPGALPPAGVRFFPKDWNEAAPPVYSEDLRTASARWVIARGKGGKAQQAELDRLRRTRDDIERASFGTVNNGSEVKVPLFDGLIWDRAREAAPEVREKELAGILKVIHGRVAEYERVIRDESGRPAASQGVTMRATRLRLAEYRKLEQRVWEHDLKAPREEREKAVAAMTRRLDENVAHFEKLVADESTPGVADTPQVRTAKELLAEFRALRGRREAEVKKE